MFQVFQMFHGYVSSVSYGCCISQKNMDVAKVDQDVASVSEVCCKRLFKMFHLFQTYVQAFFDLDVAHVSPYVARVCSKCFSLMFQ